LRQMCPTLRSASGCDLQPRANPNREGQEQKRSHSRRAYAPSLDPSLAVVIHAFALAEGRIEAQLMAF